MIVFDVKCEKDHVFEAWFRDSESFDTLRKAGQVVCPTCDSTKVEKALMAPNVAAKKGLSPTEEKQTAEKAFRMLAKMRKTVEENCDYVGPKFAEEARKIHYDEVTERNIYGEATPQESEELREEGIDFSELPWIETGKN